MQNSILKLVLLGVLVGILTSCYSTQCNRPVIQPEAKQPEAKQPEAKQPEAKQPEAKQNAAT